MVAAVVGGSIFLIQLYKVHLLGKALKVSDWFSMLYRSGGPPLVIGAVAAAITAAFAFLAHALKAERKVRASLGEDRYWQLMFDYESRQPALLRTYGPDRRFTKSVRVMLGAGAVLLGGVLVAVAVLD